MQSQDHMKNLVSRLQKDGIIQSEIVANAMSSVDRGEFCNSSNVYLDCPQYIGYNATISAPHMHAYALQFLINHLPQAESVLDVGSGSGYLVAAMYKMMQNPKGKVYGIEHIPELVQQSIKNLNKSFKDEIDEKKIQIFEADGRNGLKEFAPYDVIHVGAAASKMPMDLVNQLKNGGRMLIPVGLDEQTFKIVDKDIDGNVKIQDILAVRYVPLTSKEQQQGKWI